MKKIISILVTILSVFVLFSCTKAEEGPVDEKSPIGKADLAIAAKGGVAKIQVSSESALKAVATADWLEVSVNKDTVYATAPANESIQSRYATLVVEADGDSYKFTVMQYGFATAGFEPSDKTITAAAAEFSFDYDYTEKIEASTEASWVTLTITDAALGIKVAANEAEATDTDRQRKAEIKWSLGMEHGTITITQHNQNFMAVEDGWTLEYLGVQKYNDEDVEEISNTTAAGSDEISYAIYACKKSDLGKSDMATFVEIELAPIMKKQYDEYIAYYATVGYNLTYSDFYYEGDDFEIFDIFEAGDYYGIAISLDENCEPLGPYQYIEFTKESGSGDTPTSGYNSWLGEWEIPHGTSTTTKDTWTFTEKVKGETYTITGIEGRSDFPIEGQYDASTGNLKVVAQVELGTIDFPSFKDCPVGFYGATAAGSFWTPSDPANAYTIFTGTLSGDTATLTGSTVSDSAVERAIYIASTGDDEKPYLILKAFSDVTVIPNTLTRKSSGGGDDGGDDGDDDGGHGSDAFNRFIGGWTFTPSDTSIDPWTTTFREVKADTTLAAYAWQGWAYDWLAPIDMTFDSKSGAVTFKGGTNNGGVDSPAASNVNVGADEGGNANIYYMGCVTSSGNSYVIQSTEDFYDCCKGTYSDGKITLTGYDVKLSDGNTYTFTELTLVAMDMATGGDTYIYTYKNRTGAFPVTLEKASSSSAVMSFGKSMNLSNKENWTRIDKSQVITAEQLVTMSSPKLTAIPVDNIPAKLSKHLSK